MESGSRRTALYSRSMAWGSSGKDCSECSTSTNVKRNRNCEAGQQAAELETGVSFFFDPSIKVLAVPLDVENDASHTVQPPGSGISRSAPKQPMACLSPDARWSMGVTSGSTAALALYDLATGLPVMRMVQDIQARQLSFSPDGRHAIVGRKDGTVSVLDLVEINKQLTKLGLGW